MRKRVVMTDREGIDEAISVLERGGIIAFPTDTVYGIGCDAYSKKAVNRIYSMKRRRRDKPFVLFPQHKNTIPFYVLKQSKIRYVLYNTLIPGPTTFIMKAKVGAPKELISDSRAISVRMPDCHYLKELLKLYNRPIATTSANVSGEKPALTSSKVRLEVDLIIRDDSIPHGGVSTIVDLVPYPFILRRKGSVSIYEIERYMQHRLRFTSSIAFNVLFVCTGNSCRSPIAEWILKEILRIKRLKNVFVGSCGIMAGYGYPPTIDAIHSTSELGYDIQQHRSQPVSEDLIKDADIIFCMEKNHKRQICAISPHSTHKVFLLSEIYGNGEEIDDPIGRGIHVYRAITKVIEKYVKSIVKEFELRYRLEGNVKDR